jgi:ADP-ribosyl-[dinitrogen reductase] hydrolase
MTDNFSNSAVYDRAMGCMAGLCIGDAVGTTLEFSERDSYEPLEDMVGGGPFYLDPGEWTDDTSMALCIADSLIERGEFDPEDMMKKFREWYRSGYNSHNGRCFDIGNTVRGAIHKYESYGDPFVGGDGPRSAGNGSIMRLAPVPIFFRGDREKNLEVAVNQSRLTHSTNLVLDACKLLAHVLVEAINGKRKEEIFPVEMEEIRSQKVNDIAMGSWEIKTRNEIGSTGFVIDTLEASVWAVMNNHDFESAVLAAANLGKDSDTTAAVTGQIAGALYGLEGIPCKWMDKLAWKDKILTRAKLLFNLGRS